MASSTNKMEADQALTNRSIPHRRVCGASRTKDLIDSKRGGELAISEASAIFFKREEVETEGLFLISRPILFGLEDTTRKKFQSEAALIRSIQDASIHPIKACKLGLQFRFRSKFCFGFFYCFFCFFFYLLSI